MTLPCLYHGRDPHEQQHRPVPQFYPSPGACIHHPRKYLASKVSQRSSVRGISMPAGDAITDPRHRNRIPAIHETISLLLIDSPHSIQGPYISFHAAGE